MKKALVIGGTGMLGHKLVQRMSPRFEVATTIRRSFESVEHFGIFERNGTFENVDVINLDTVIAAIKHFRPDVVINAAGVTKHAPGSADIERTLIINSVFPHQLARLGDRFGFRLITISTDCVFRGTRGMYKETEMPDSLDLYGQSKHWGELNRENCLTIRTSIIGRELETEYGLIEWFLLQRGKSAKGYSNAIFTGFPTLVFADILIDIIEGHPEIFGVFHVSSDPISKYELLRVVNTKLRAGVHIVRDADFVLDRSLDGSNFMRETGFRSPSWKEMIEQMAADETPYDKWKDQI